MLTEENSAQDESEWLALCFGHSTFERFPDILVRLDGTISGFYSGHAWYESPLRPHPDQGRDFAHYSSKLWGST
jgi:hypothetical protein